MARAKGKNRRTERFTISLDANLAKAFDALIRAKGYENRSEAVRDILRQQLGVVMNHPASTLPHIATQRSKLWLWAAVLAMSGVCEFAPEQLSRASIGVTH